MYCRYSLLIGGCAQSYIYGALFKSMGLLGLICYFRQKPSKVFRYLFGLLDLVVVLVYRFPIMLLFTSIIDVSLVLSVSLLTNDEMYMVC